MSVAGLAMSPGSWNSPARTATNCAGLSSARHASTWLSGSSSTMIGFTVYPFSSTTKVHYLPLERRCRGLLRLLPRSVERLVRCHWDTQCEAIGVWREAFGEDDSREPSSSGVMSSVLKPRRDSPSTVSRGPVTSTRKGVSPNVPKSPVSRTVRSSRGSSAGWRVAQLGTTLYHRQNVSLGMIPERRCRPATVSRTRQRQPR